MDMIRIHESHIFVLRKIHFIPSPVLCVESTEPSLQSHVAKHRTTHYYEFASFLELVSDK